MRIAGRIRQGVGALAAAARVVWDERRFDLEVELRQVDRLMMQSVQMSLSLIGFGFTINAFFNEAAAKSQDPRADQAARRIGLALLLLGLVFLATSIVSQMRYRHEVVMRYTPEDRSDLRRQLLESLASPSFLTAWLLLLIGGGALVSVLLRGIP